METLVRCLLFTSPMANFGFLLNLVFSGLLHFFFGTCFVDALYICTRFAMLRARFDKRILVILEPMPDVYVIQKGIRLRDVL